MLIHESQHFIIIVPAQPHVARGDGGHLIINPKVVVADRTQLAPALAVELMKLTMVAGAAMVTVLTRHGVDIGRINYQDNGNWRHELHVHLYGRARSAKMQPWGQPLAFPPTAQAFREQMGNLEALNAEDVSAMCREIESLLQTEKYRSFQL